VWVKRVFYQNFNYWGAHIQNSPGNLWNSQVVMKRSWSPWNMFTCTFETVLHMRSLIIKFWWNIFWHTLLAIYRDVWCIVWCCWWCYHWSNGDSSQITLSVHLVGIVLYLHLPIPGILKVNSFKPYCMHQMQCFHPLDDGITIGVLWKWVIYGWILYTLLLCLYQRQYIVIDVSSFVSRYMHVRQLFTRRNNIFIGCNICYA